MKFLIKECKKERNNKLIKLKKNTERLKETKYEKERETEDIKK